MYLTMGIYDCIAIELVDYGNKVKVLCENDLYYNELCSRIKANKSKLFEEKKSVDDWARLLKQIVDDYIKSPSEVKADSKFEVVVEKDEPIPTKVKPKIEELENVD
ncbi:Uncharacterised protein [uncultured archaeon]|nr:Uncharacterised protein [uncultured archaeon]